MMEKDRKRLGKPKKSVLIPVPPQQSEMDAPYFELRDSIVTRIKKTRQRFIMQANSSMIELYWHIGNDILKRQESEGWGTKVIDRLSADLKEEISEMSGFSPRNLKYMRKFAENWPDSSIINRLLHN
jgi:predicted nuclease of restriction endonuclease-like (RecB) superfamily